MTDEKPFFDLDHVVLRNGKIYRVLGNFRSETYFWGYQVYTPDHQGDQMYRGQTYRKNFWEDEQRPRDVREIYELIPRREVVCHLDPIQVAQEKGAGLQQTVWLEMYEAFKEMFGANAVGIFGSTMFDMHLTAEGQVRKDVDFVIEGLQHVERLRSCLPDLRRRLGLQPISAARQQRQYQRYQKVFRHPRNTIEEIIKRR